MDVNQIIDLDIDLPALTMPSQAHHVDFFEMIEAVNQDRESTLRFLKKGREEGNPILGPRPHRDKVNGLIALLLLVPFAISSLSPTWKSSIYDTMALNFRMAADRNNAMERGEDVDRSEWPNGLGFVVTWRK